MKNHPALDRTGLALLSVVVSGIILVGVILIGPAVADDSAKSATEASKEYVETAKPTNDGTVHPNGKKAEPGEQWFTPCPSDQKITKSGECVGMDEAGSGEHSQK